MEKRLKEFLCALILIFAISGISFGSSTKAINFMDLEITRSGVLIPSGHVSSADLSMYIPQNYYDIKSNVNWSIVDDRYGNKMVHLHFENLAGEIPYKVVVRVKNSAKYIDKPNRLSSGRFEETPLIKSNDDMIKFSYGRNSVDGFLKLFKYASSFKYDKSLSKVQMPSDWSFENKRGTCDELSNCLIALAELSGVKARAVDGYAYRSPGEKTLGNHAWVQVLTDKGWMNADPTWNELGYLDASHIVLAYLPDTNMTEEIKYKGSGSISWKKNEDKFRIINYTYFNPVEISASYDGGYEGYIKANLIGPCYMADLNALSCVDDGNPVVDIKDNNRLVWFCDNKTVYWAYESNGKPNGVCPINIYDQSGVKKTVDINLKPTYGEVSIVAPDTVSSGNNFTLRVLTRKNFVLFSPNLTLPNARGLNIKLWDPGVYKFYAFDGNLFEKDVSVVKKKLFNITISSPDDVYGKFNVSVSVDNLGDERNVALEVTYGHQIYKKRFDLKNHSVFTFQFNSEKNENVVKAIVSDGDVELSTKQVNVKGSLLQDVVNILNYIWNYLLNFVDSF